ncbi:MAG: hypothetical protein LDLANPLL_01282 [Turneriella sp.]|nr:hypothetical protein [Turneriella sp.]
MKDNFVNEEENLTAHFLRKEGFTVIARNTRRFGAEIDLLCTKEGGDTYFIFEVKRRPRSKSAMYPRISKRQLLRLKTAALKIQQEAEKFLTVRIYLALVDRHNATVEIIEVV